LLLNSSKPIETLIHFGVQIGVHQGTTPIVPRIQDETEEWDSDPFYVNDVSEKEQRKGSSQLKPKIDHHFNMHALRSQVTEENTKNREKHHHSSQKKDDSN